LARFSSARRIIVAIARSAGCDEETPLGATATARPPIVDSRLEREAL
jgi:hypothetical protein